MRYVNDFLTFLGTTNGSGRWYLWWSGMFGNITIFAAVIVFYRRHNGAFPGCRRPPVDCHHITWWTHGGASTLDNAAWLCAFHHWLVHERGWNIRRNNDRTFTFLYPNGIEYRRRTQAA